MKDTKTANCQNCGFKEDYEPCEFGLTYFQAEGTCPGCGHDLIDENGKPTKETITFEVKE